MTEDEILAIFREHSALLEGHFILSSGLHSDRYIQCALVLQHPRIAEQLCSELAGRLRHLDAKVVAAPALGGVIVAHEVAHAQSARCSPSGRTRSWRCDAASASRPVSRP